MFDKIISDAKRIGADYVLYNEWEGKHTHEYNGEILSVYFMKHRQVDDMPDMEFASYQPGDIAGVYLGFGYPEVKLYERLWSNEMISKYKRITIS